MNLDELYQTVVLDHSKSPRNHREMADATQRAFGDNPSCGDEVEIYIKCHHDKLEDVSFTGAGCSICMASASMLTQKVKNLELHEASEFSKAFSDMILGEEDVPPPKMLGDLRLLKTVRRFPQRVKCATLAWHALDQALAEASPATTPSD